jgi:formate dehydrogenase subunit gamma
MALMLVVTYGTAVALTGAADFVRPAAAESGLEGQAATGSPEAGNVPGQSLGNISDAEIWRRIRGGAPGTVSIPQSEAAVLIQSEGEEWRSIRNGPLTTYGASIVLGVIAFAALYFLARGRIRIAGGRSGRHLVRFTLAQRIIHWFAAVLFVLLGLTGLVLLYGKHVLIPAFGPAAFGAIAAEAAFAGLILLWLRRMTDPVMRLISDADDHAGTLLVEIIADHLIDDQQAPDAT